MSTFRWLTVQAVSLLRQFGNLTLWVALLAYLIHESAATFKAFAGRNSSANVLLKVAAQFSATVTISIAVSLATSGLWWREYRRHSKTRQRLT